MDEKTTADQSVKPVRASVIIPTRSNISYLISCLEALYPTLTEEDEVILVLNGSTDENAGVKRYIETLTLASSSVTPIRTSIIDISPESGFCVSANAGMKAARGAFLVLLNDDTLPTPDWLAHLIDALEEAKAEFPEVTWGYIGPMTNAGAIPIQDLSPHFEQATDPEQANAFSAVLFRGDFRRFIPAGSLSSFCLLMTRQAYEAVGDFDSATFGLGGYETNDLMIRAREKGFLAAIAPKVFVYHFGAKTLQRVAPQAFEGTANQERFMTKWYRPTAKTCCAAYRVKIDNGLEANLFLQSLARMSELCDWAVIVDAQSKIDVQNQIKAAGFEHFVRYYRRSPKTPEENEVADRNILLTMVRSTNPDWIWMADQDEWPAPKLTREKLERLLNPRNPCIRAYTAPIFVLWKSSTYVRVDSRWGELNREFLFRNEAWGFIHSGVNDISCRRLPTLVPQDAMYHTGAVVLLNHEYADPEGPAGVTRRRLISQDEAPALEEEAPVVLSKLVVPDFTYLLMARNESKLLLRHIFEHFSWADDFRVLDTGSIDHSRNLCTSLGIEVDTWRCCKDAEDPEHLLCDFGAARNYAIDQCKTEFVLFMDPDEKLNHQGILLIPRVLLEDRDAYALRIHNYRRDGRGVIRIQPTMQPRLFRRLPEIRYEPEIHETLESAFERNPHLRFTRSDFILVEHEGFLMNSDNSPQRRWKNEEYAKRLISVLEKTPEDARAMYALAQHLIANGEVEDGDAMLTKALSYSPVFFHCRFALVHRLLFRAYQLLKATPKQSIQYQEMEEVCNAIMKDLSKWVPEC